MKKSADKDLEKVLKLIRNVLHIELELVLEREMISESTMEKVWEPVGDMKMKEKKRYLKEIEIILKTIKSEDEILEYLKQYETIGGI